ncbi:unnamed protein product [Closterium sp. Naga37s-1]|nr:unnamed protein product [Closterium sp. Naga37s-1]
MAGSAETTRQAARTEVRSTRGARRARGQRGAARGVSLIPPFHSLQHGGQRGDDTAGGTDGGEVLIHRFNEVDSWGEEGEGAERGSKRRLSNPPLPFPLAWRAARRRHGGGTRTEVRCCSIAAARCPRPEDRLRLRHRCCAAGVADGVGSDAARA